MESGLSVVPILSHARNTKQWLPLDLKRQTLRPSKVGKIHRKSSASMRVRCENAKDGRIEMDRRRLLLSSSTLGVSALTSSKAQSKPFPAPELLQCQYPTALPEGARVEGGCCPPFTRETPVDFTFPTSIPMRKRKAAHLLDIESIEKYDKALKLMKNLPPEDPRSFTQQAKVHCAYCNGAYTVGSGILAVHGSWLFAPFHRWYIYFYERILGSLIHDDTFALPFWNWDAEEGMQIPPIYADKCRYFYDKNRDECHQAPVIINLKSPKSCESGLVEANYSTINTQMKADTALTFHGGPIR
ncbi:hypothetical protein SUGI_0565700 [Cryptomeria japonica]|nr:hypothetical protein SUGI_0565700 [Cryptomeria japonica]